MVHVEATKSFLIIFAWTQLSGRSSQIPKAVVLSKIHVYIEKYVLVVDKVSQCQNCVIF